jgi:hypothetical protein
MSRRTHVLSAFVHVPGLWGHLVEGRELFQASRAHSLRAACRYRWLLRGKSVDVFFWLEKKYGRKI